jgi:hypothetical protein
MESLDRLIKHKLQKEGLGRQESLGNVADSHAVRLDLMKRVRLGGITLEEAKNELKNIKSLAKKDGKITRIQAMRR